MELKERAEDMLQIYQEGTDEFEVAQGYLDLLEKKVQVVIMKSTYDPKYYAISINDIRHGVDAGPWKDVGTAKVRIKDIL